MKNLRITANLLTRIAVLLASLALPAAAAAAPTSALAPVLGDDSNSALRAVPKVRPELRAARPIPMPARTAPPTATLADPRPVDATHTAPAQGMTASGAVAPPMDLYAFSPLAKVTSPTSGRWAQTVKIFMTKKSGMIGVCSGALVGHSLVVTAGHCVYDHKAGEPKKIEVVPGYHYGSMPFGKAAAVGKIHMPGWINKKNYDDDFAILTLDRPIGALVGWFGYGHDPDGKFYTGNSFARTGYPAAKPYNGQQLYSQSGTFDSVNGGILYNKVNSYGGMSGGGVNSPAGHVYGVHSHTYLSAPYGSGVTRINKDKFDRISAARTGMNPPSADLVPMRVKAASTASAGSKIAGASVLVFNRSDKAYSGNLVAKLYLSTDKTISSADTLVGSYNFPASKIAGHTASQLVLPSSLSSALAADLPTGTYHLGVIIQAADYAKANNTTGAQDVAAVAINGSADLALSMSSTVSGLMRAGDKIDVSFTITNLGGASAGGFDVDCYASLNTDITYSDHLIGGATYSSLSAGDSSLYTVNGILPAGMADGTYYIGCLADSGASVPEPAESNNQGLAVGSVTVDNTAPKNPAAATDANGATSGVATAITDCDFTWDAGSDASGIKSYLVYWGPFADGTSALETITSAYDVPEVLNGQTHYLRVRARDNAGNLASDWVTLFVLTARDEQPSPAVPTQPEPTNPGQPTEPEPTTGGCSLTGAGAADPAAAGIMMVLMVLGLAARRRR